MRKDSVLLYGPQGTGKTLVAAELAKHLQLEQVVEDWLAPDPYPTRDTLVIAALDDPMTLRHFGGRRIHIEEALRLLDTSLADVIERSLAARRRSMH